MLIAFDIMLLFCKVGASGTLKIIAPLPANEFRDEP